MGKVLLDMAMSLDGYIAGPQGEDSGLNDWFFAPSDDATSGKGMIVAESIHSLGAIIMGKRTYDLADKADAFVDNPIKLRMSF